MPMYEYRCHKCNAKYEEIAAADENVPCPECGSTDTERLISACACHTGGGSDAGYDSCGSGGHGGSCGCSGCSGGNCASCGH